MCCYYQDKVERICKIYHLAELTNSIPQNQTNKQRVHVETLKVLMESRGGAPVVYGLSRHCYFISCQLWVHYFF